MTQNSPDTSVLAQNLTRALRSSALTPEALAAGSGVHKTTVYRILNGQMVRPRMATIRRIARALGIPTLELTGDAAQLLLDPSWAARPSAPSGAHMEKEAILDEFRQLPEWLQLDGAKAILLALLDVSLGRLDTLAASGGRSDSEKGQLEELIVRQWEAVPSEVRLSAAEDSVRSLVQLRVASGEAPDSALYSRLTRLRKERGRRHRKRASAVVRPGPRPGPP